MTDHEFFDYDESITVGTLITAYHKGYHILTRIDFVEATVFTPASVHYYYSKVLTEDGKPATSAEKCCHSSYCRRVDKSFADAQLKNMMEQATQLHQSLQKYV